MEILVYPDERLRIAAKPVEKIDDSVVEIANRMCEVMHQAQGVGLAATQIGVDKRIIVVNPDPEKGEDVILINPVIVRAEGRVIGEEGCLSVPGVRGNVARAQNAVLKALSLDEEEITLTGEDFIVRIWQHEIDHLDGILFIDKVTSASRLSIKRQLREYMQKRRP